MNTQTQEALKMAIEQFERINNEYPCEEIIDICKEALEQPAQEPINNCPNCNSWFTKEIHSIPAPSWQGLSDDEIAKVFDDIGVSTTNRKIYRAIEQALKEKNT